MIAVNKNIEYNDTYGQIRMNQDDSMILTSIKLVPYLVLKEKKDTFEALPYLPSLIYLILSFALLSCKSKRHCD